MAEEVKNEETIDNNTLVDQVKELKENTVSKSDYEKLQSDYNHLFGEYIKSRPSQTEGVVKEPTEEERKAAFQKDCITLATDKHMSNIEKAKLYLRIRDYRLEQGEGDIFLPRSGQPEQRDVEIAENQAALMKDAIEQAEGSDLRYNAYISDHLRDNMAILKQRK